MDRAREAVARLFRPSGGQDRHAAGGDPAAERVGIEVEVIPVDAETGARIHPTRGPNPLSPRVQEIADRAGWSSSTSPVGVPSWELPGGGWLSWEPGGQLEFASPPLEDASRVGVAASELMRALADELRPAGIRLLARGMDPRTRVEETELVLEAPRYRRMTRHYRADGPEGERMMRLTAGVHLNLDLGPRPLLRWRAANRIVPALLAAFANSPRRADAERPHRSHRSEQWRALDPTRTGCFTCHEDPVEEYLRFALDARAFTLGEEEEPALPLRAWTAELSDAELRRHLSTLFPEVRPRGYLELRFFDALPADAYLLPIAASVGLLLDRENEAWAASGLPAPTPERLERAGRAGLGDRELLAEANDLLARACRGLHRLGDRHGAARLHDDLDRFRRDFTCGGRDPGHSPADFVEDRLDG